MFITYSNSLFNTKTKVKHTIDVNFALRHATCLHLTSSNDQHLLLGMITSLRSQCMTSCYHQADNQLAGKSYGICRLWVIEANSVPNM